MVILVGTLLILSTPLSWEYSMPDVSHLLIKKITTPLPKIIIMSVRTPPFSQ